MPENSRPSVKGGVTRERLFWCLPRVWLIRGWRERVREGAYVEGVDKVDACGYDFDEDVVREGFGAVDGGDFDLGEGFTELINHDGFHVAENEGCIFRQIW